MFSYLKSQRVNLQLLQESACRELLLLLEKIDGSKTIVLDSDLVGPISLMASISLFSDRSIPLLKLIPNITFPPNVSNIIFLVRPKIAIMNIIAELVLKSSDKLTFHLFFVPRKSCLCQMHLEHKGVFGSFRNIEELSWNFFPIDSDVISMEMPLAYRDITIESDPTALYQAALGLLQLQRLYGRIPKIYGKGHHAQQLWEHAKQLVAQDKTLLNGDKGAINQLIILDRSLDLLTPLATQLTYEGLIDEFYGIKHNQLSLPAEHFNSTTNESMKNLTPLMAGPKTLLLNSSDKTYAVLRDKNFNEVGQILARDAKEISAQIKASNNQESSMQEIKRLVEKLPELLEQKKSLALHTTMAELLREKVDDNMFSDDLTTEQDFMVCRDVDKINFLMEELIGIKRDLRDVLRLMCIQCAAASGFKEKVLNFYKRELVQVYGLEVLLTISNLEKAGLLRTQSDTRSYAVLRKTLNLTVDDAKEVNPKDLSYVHSFYAPLLPRIVEQSLKPLGWQSLKSKINNLPGPTFEDFQAQLIGIGGRQSSTPSEGSLLNTPRVVLVFFVGGCTYAEISALRFLAQQEDNNVEFLIATTKIINKYNFLDSLM